MFRNKLIFNKYKIKNLKRYSKLSWEFQGINLKDNEPIFIKIEKKNLKYNFLESEAYCLFNLKGFGIPKIISYGKVGIYNILIEELLGTSLYELWKLRNKKEKSILKNVYMVALQALDRLEYMHSKNYIHRDVKPQNFVNGRNDPNIIYIIDFGLSHQYRSSRTGKHIKCIKRKEVMGSLSYISIKGNIGYEESRRDDLESLGYMLIFLATDNLPWLRIEDLEVNKLTKLKKIYQLKKALSVEQLCEGLPDEFAKYITYSRKLNFEENPDYDYLRSLFSSILVKYQEKNDLNFFWTLKKHNIIKDEKERKSISPNFINRRKDSSKNRLFKKIKKSLEKSENQRIAIQHNNLFFEHVSNLNFKPIYQKKNYSYNEINRNYENIKNISHDEKIMNRNDMNISYNIKKFTFNVNNSSNKKKENIQDENIILKNKPISTDNKSINDYKTRKFYNYESYINMIKPLVQNHKFDLVSKYFSTDNALLNQNNNEANNNINTNNYNRKILFNDNNEQNDISNKKRIGKKILIKRNNNYRTLYEREKEKEKSISSARSKHNINCFFVNFNKFNQINKNNNSPKIQISLDHKTFNSLDKIGNINQKKFIKTNVNSNSINISLLKSKRNMKISTSPNIIKKNMFKINIKHFHINKFKKNNHLYNSCDKDISNNKLKFPKEN